MQNSSLQKGLIFHAPLDEWSGTRDMVSKVLGTNTDTYPVLSKSGSGRRSYDFDGVDDYVALPTIPALGTGDFTVIVKVKGTGDGIIYSAYDNLVSGTGIIISVGAITPGYISAWYRGAIVREVKASSLPINDGLEHIITVRCTRSLSTGFQIFVDGIECSYSQQDDLSIAGGIFLECTNAKLGRNNYQLADFFSGSISMLRIFNYALSAQQIINYSKPEYPIEATHRGSGATKNVLDLNAEGMTAAYWYDKTNSLTATNSGATLQIPSASNLGATMFGSLTSVITFNDADNLTFPSDQFSYCVKATKFESAKNLLFANKRGGSAYEYIFYSSPSNLIFYLYDAGSNANFIGFVCPLSLTPYIEYSICFTYKNGVGKMIINGVEATVQTTGSFTAFANTSAPYTVGTVNTTDSTSIIRDVRHYSYALSVDDAKLIHDSN